MRRSLLYQQKEGTGALLAERARMAQNWNLKSIVTVRDPSAD
jgi:hypothetical protein